MQKSVFKQGHLLHRDRQGYSCLFLDVKVVIKVSEILIGSFVSYKPLAFEATINRGMLFYSFQEFPTRNTAAALKCTILIFLCEAATITFALHQMKYHHFC